MSKSKFKGFSELFDSQKGEIVHHNRTICELHRELYDLCVVGLSGKDTELMSKMIKVLEDAFIMGVKMNRKLCEHKLGSSSKWNEEEFRNKEISRKEAIKRRKRRKKLIKMLKDNDEILEKFDKYRGKGKNETGK